MIWFRCLPNYLEKKIEYTWSLQGAENLEVTGYKISVSPPPFGIFFYSADIVVEVKNTGDTTIEILEINTEVTNKDGNNTAARTDGNVSGNMDSAGMLQVVDTTYYQKLPSHVGILIPPGQTRPFYVWRGFLLDQEESNVEEVDITVPYIFWKTYGPSLFIMEQGAYCVCSKRS